MDPRVKPEDDIRLDPRVKPEDDIRLDPRVKPEDDIRLDPRVPSTKFIVSNVELLRIGREDDSITFHRESFDCA
jgi:hypothetical protein